MNFLDFEEFNKTNPIYINIVRHPVERVISWYYYIRQNWYALNWDNDTAVEIGDMKLDKFRTLTPSRYKLTFEDCILAQDPECSYPIGSKAIYQDGEKSYWSQVRLYFRIDLLQKSIDTMPSRNRLLGV